MVITVSFLCYQWATCWWEIRCTPRARRERCANRRRYRLVHPSVVSMLLFMEWFLAIWVDRMAIGRITIKEQHCSWDIELLAISFRFDYLLWDFSHPHDNALTTSHQQPLAMQRVMPRSPPWAGSKYGRLHSHRQNHIFPSSSLLIFHLCQKRQ